MNRGKSLSIPALATQPHSTEQGGLRGHSIGSLYPYSVDPVYDKGWKKLGWIVRNLLTGQSSSKPESYRGAESLARVLKRRRDYQTEAWRLNGELEGRLEYPVIDRRGFADRF